MNTTEIEEYEIIFREGQMKGVYAMAFVKNPATRLQTIALSEDAEEPEEQNMADEGKINVEFTSIEPYKQQVTGAVLAPNQKVFRMTKTGKPYFITFSAEIIEKLRNDFMRKKATDEINVEHDKEQKLSGVYVVESYIITEDLQHQKLGLPLGSWVLTYQITDKQFFEEQILTKNVTGLSLEGEFGLSKYKMSEEVVEKLAEKKEYSELAYLKDILYLCDI